MTWKYRGQVIPTDDCIRSEVEIVEVGRDEHGVYAIAEGYLWVDDRRIYSTKRMGMRIVDGHPQAPESVDASPCRFDMAPVRAWWADWFGMDQWPVADLHYALAERFVHDVHFEDREAFDAVSDRGVLYLANHQVMVESLLFSVISAGLAGRPTVALAKSEHQSTWLGRLIDLCFRWPEARDPEVLAFFDRSRSGDLPALAAELLAGVAAGERSLLVHAEGTRAMQANRPVEKLAGAFVDGCIAAGVPIVPVRFVGGLPLEGSETRCDFPVGYGRQDYWIGRPILPSDLRELDYGARRARVLEAMNGLGPAPGDEQPFPHDAHFAARVREIQAVFGSDAAHAVMLEVLADVTDPHPAIAQLVHAARAFDTSPVALPQTPEGAWTRELAERLFGTRGPTLLGE